MNQEMSREVYHFVNYAHQLHQLFLNSAALVQELQDENKKLREFLGDLSARTHESYCASYSTELDCDCLNSKAIEVLKQGKEPHAKSD